MKIEYVAGQRFKVYDIGEVQKMNKAKRIAIAKAIWSKQT